MPEKIVADSEDDLLAILANRIDQPELCLAAMQHPHAKERVLELIAEKGPTAVLPSLLTLPTVEGTTAQRMAQKRLQEAAESTASDSDDDDTYYSSDNYDDDRETGTCDCRWR